MTFEEFLDAELDALDRYTRVLVGDRQLAHDCLADALIKVQARWSKIAVLDNPVAYVRRVITNAFLDHRRSWAHRMLHLVAPEHLPDAPATPAVSGIADRAQLHELLQRLQRQQRAAIVMRHGDDPTHVVVKDRLAWRELGRGYVAVVVGPIGMSPADLALAASVRMDPAVHPAPVAPAASPAQPSGLGPSSAITGTGETAVPPSR